MPRSKDELIQMLRGAVDVLDKQWENLTMGAGTYPLVRLGLPPDDDDDRLVLVVGIEIEDGEDEEK